MAILSRLQRELLHRAASVRQHAYAPYSRFKVGAAVYCEITGSVSGIFVGCNVENVSSGMTVCAERNAVAAAVAAGAEPGDITRIAIVGGEPGGPPITPCGACRQVLAEFSASADAKGGMEIICAPNWTDREPGSAEEAEERDAVVIYTLAELLPHAFSM